MKYYGIPEVKKGLPEFIVSQLNPSGFTRDRELYQEIGGKIMRVSNSIQIRGYSRVLPAILDPGNY